MSSMKTPMHIYSTLAAEVSEILGVECELISDVSNYGHNEGVGIKAMLEPMIRFAWWTMKDGELTTFARQAPPAKDVAEMIRQVGK